MDKWIIKFIVMFTFPSKKRWVAGMSGKNFSLYPLVENSRLENILAFDTEEEADQWLEQFKIKQADKWAKWQTVNPKIVAVEFIPLK